MSSLVSIVIPCYNDGAFLPEAVASARAQTYSHVEIIVVDDHSDDPATLLALEQAAQMGVRVLQTANGKKGLSAARNTGIANAAGEFMLPLDADDTIHPGYVAKAVEAFSQDKTLGICYCRAHLFGLKRGPWQLPPYDFERMLQGNIIFATALYRKEVWLEVGGYNETLCLGLEDYDFWLKIIDRGYTVKRLDEVLFFYRIKKKSMAALLKGENRDIQAISAVFQSCRKIYEKHAEVLLMQAYMMRREKDSLSGLYTWRMIQPFVRMELAVRSFVKKRLGMIA